MLIKPSTLLQSQSHLVCWSYPQALTECLTRHMPGHMLWWLQVAREQEYRHKFQCSMVKCVSCTREMLIQHGHVRSKEACVFCQHGYASTDRITGHSRSESQGTLRPLRCRFKFLYSGRHFRRCSPQDL